MAAAILLEVDEVIVKPFEIGRLTELVNVRVLNRKTTNELPKERVGPILRRWSTGIIEGWLTGCAVDAIHGQPYGLRSGVSDKESIEDSLGGFRVNAHHGGHEQAHLPLMACTFQPRLARNRCAQELGPEPFGWFAPTKFTRVSEPRSWNHYTGDPS